ncbi:hypothetical protein J1614_001508 [Plenodomus biglobosus]|nr:hypothetical protein J1614_001508 [Plenodomus biglobosus]
MAQLVPRMLQSLSCLVVCVDEAVVTREPGRVGSTEAGCQVPDQGIRRGHILATIAHGYFILLRDHVNVVSVEM